MRCRPAGAIEGRLNQRGGSRPGTESRGGRKKHQKVLDIERETFLEKKKGEGGQTKYMLGRENSKIRAELKGLGVKKKGWGLGK